MSDLLYTLSIAINLLQNDLDVAEFADAPTLANFA
jgi:hypothetical protein